MKSIRLNAREFKALITELTRVRNKNTLETYPLLIWSMYRKLQSAQAVQRATTITVKRLADIMKLNNATREEENLIMDGWLRVRQPKKLVSDSSISYNDYSGYESQPLMNYADKHGV